MKAIGKNQSGMSLVELAIVLGIAAILLTIGVSSWQTMNLRTKKSSGAEDIVSLIFQARSLAGSSSWPARIEMTSVANAPGGGISASVTDQDTSQTIWSQAITFGSSSRYAGLGLISADTGPFTITPRGRVRPGGFTLQVRDTDFAASGEEVTIDVSLLGEVSTTP